MLHAVFISFKLSIFKQHVWLAFVVLCIIFNPHRVCFEVPHLSQAIGFYSNILSSFSNGIVSILLTWNAKLHHMDDFLFCLKKLNIKGFFVIQQKNKTTTQQKYRFLFRTAIIIILSE